MSVDQMTELMRRNAEFLVERQRENAENVRLMIGQLFQEFNAGGGGLRRGGDLRERQFREISCFTGEESHRKEWSLKYQAAVKEANPEIYDELKWAVSETDDVTRPWSTIA